MVRTAVVALVVLAIVATGCASSSGRHAATPRTTPSSSTTSTSAGQSGAAATTITAGSSKAVSPTTTARASTTASSNAALPLAPPCNAGQTGSGLRPALIFIGCATSADYLSHLVWNNWTVTSATATAVHNVDDCRPNCAQGTYSHFPVRVTLSDPGIVAGLAVFGRISAIPTTSVGAPETATLPPGTAGAWGWVPDTPK
jgi:hypothetical protein